MLVDGKHIRRHSEIEKAGLRGTSASKQQRHGHMLIRARRPRDRRRFKPAHEIEARRSARDGGLVRALRD